MALSDIRQTIRDGALGAIVESIDSVGVMFGVCSAGAPGQVYSFVDSQDVADTLGRGPLAEAVASVLASAGRGPVYAVPVDSDVAGKAGAVTKTGTGPDITVSGVPNDAYEVIVRVVKAGAVGTSEVIISVDGGDVWSGQIATSATYPVPDTGLTLAFPAGAYVAGDEYSLTCKAPGYSVTKLGEAIDAFLGGRVEASLALVVGTPESAAAAASLAVAVHSKMHAATGKYRYMRSFIECADVADAELITAFSAVDASRVVACAGFCELVSPSSLRFYKRSAAWAAFARALAVNVERHLGAVRDGGLVGVRAIHRDEARSPMLNDQRFLTLRTRIGKTGYFIEQPWTLAQKSSDYSTLHNGRVMDKACRIAYNAMVDYLNEDWFLNPEGRLSDAERERMQSDILQQIVQGMGQSISQARFAIFTSDDILGTQTISCQTGILSKGYSRFIDNVTSFVKKIKQGA